VQPGIFNFTALRVIERFSDEDGIVIEEMMLVEDKNRHAQFMLRIVELNDEQTLKLTVDFLHIVFLINFVVASRSTSPESARWSRAHYDALQHFPPPPICWPLASSLFSTSRYN
jgi:hypothetical protein